MTTQKAIWILEKWIGIIEREFFYKSVEERAALKLAMIALEKQTKKKYMRKGNQEICPCCGNGINRIAPKEDYCHKCGQKIDWE